MVHTRATKEGITSIRGQERFQHQDIAPQVLGMLSLQDAKGKTFFIWTSLHPCMRNQTFQIQVGHVWTFGNVSNPYQPTTQVSRLHSTHYGKRFRVSLCFFWYNSWLSSPTLEFRFLVCHRRFNWASRLFRIRKVTLKESDLDVKHKEEENSDFHKLLNAVRRRVPITMKNNACRFCNHNKNHPIQLE